MPPVRSTSQINLVGSERSREENRERAYIAASRRSDRSLESRVESARRASEIHRRRTGRSLRVREEDVRNEEMYEEEDDDAASRLRRMEMLNCLIRPFSSKLQRSLAVQLNMSDVLSQALLPDQACQFASTRMRYTNEYIGSMDPGSMSSPCTIALHDMTQSPYTTGVQEWQSQQQQLIYGRPVPIASPKDLTPHHNQQQIHTDGNLSNAAPYHPHMECQCMPMLKQLIPLPNADSHPTVFRGVGSNTVGNTCFLSQQLPTLPRSASADTLDANSAAASQLQERDYSPVEADPCKNRNRSHSGFSIRSFRAYSEVEQLLGMVVDTQHSSRSMYFSTQHTEGSPTGYYYNPNGSDGGQQSCSSKFESIYSTFSTDHMFPCSAQNALYLSQRSYPEIIRHHNAREDSAQAIVLTNLNRIVPSSASWSLSAKTESVHAGLSSPPFLFDTLSSMASTSTNILNHRDDKVLGDTHSSPYRMRHDAGNECISPKVGQALETSWNFEDFVNVQPPT